MYRWIPICLIVLTFSCGKRSSDDFQESAAAINRRLIQDLKGIESREDLLEISPRLKKRFYELVEVMVLSDEYAQKHSLEEPQVISEYVDKVQHLLRSELERIYTIDGCREIIEKCQEGALEKFDRYQQRSRHRKV